MIVGQRLPFCDSARASDYAYGRSRNDFRDGAIRIGRFILDSHAGLFPDGLNGFLAIELDEAALCLDCFGWLGDGKEDLSCGVRELVYMMDGSGEWGFAYFILNSNVRLLTGFRSVSALEARDESGKE